MSKGSDHCTKGQTIMTTQHGNLSSMERATSAVLGMGFTLLALSRRPTVLRALSGILAGGLFARAAASHCAVKSVLTGEATLGEAIRDQWRGIASHPRIQTHGLPGSPLHRKRSEAVDQAGEDSFPASDPPASRLSDEPPANAEAKWAAARTAGQPPTAAGTDAVSGAASKPARGECDSEHPREDG
jgi:hypothetical protein